ncbi:uncharacterized protein Tco025E_04870 [Trypanosoma conorhini]|uniref:CW-type domain-containing protein n=1 Tax=Trypanosoma conorhini TaxID=83891 RepID=A0A3S5ITC4_9TRYP|nr:uncharacterized protein Tco025E_04870 [Trypanosoma conorhini]RNF17415.1 hypothetical protein Tco025E_04870 [Trypanosoma conorhini]
MAARPLQRGPEPSLLWDHFLAADVTHTFRALFAEKLSAVSDRREFSTRLTALMRQWRAEHWHDIFIGAATKRRGDGGEDEKGGAAAAARRWERGLAAYYESIRVQRLMDETLFFHLSEADALEVDKLGRRELRRRRGLVRAVDEVWRAGKAAADFLLPVTEQEAPLYYRRVRRPVCVASIYCSVWEGEVEDYAGLKVLLTLMRSNCELYNGGGSPLVAACQELVSVGFRAAREAQAHEEEEEEAEEAANGGAGGSAAGGGDNHTRFPPRTEAELAWLFPPRHEAAQLPPVDNSHGATAAGRGVAHDAGEPRRVLRLIRRTGAQEPMAPAAENPTGTATTRRLTLRLAPRAAVVADAAAAPSPSKTRRGKKEAKDDATTATAATARGRRNKTRREVEVKYWMRCDLCHTWRVVAEELDPLPEHWDCSLVGLPCSPPEATPRGERRPASPGPKKRPGRRKTRGGAKAPEAASGKRGRRKTTRGVAERKAGGEATLPQEEVARQKRKNASRAAAPRKRNARRSPSSSSSSSSSTSSSDSTGSSGSSSSDADTPPRHGRGRKSRRAPQQQQRRQRDQQQECSRGRKRSRVTRNSSWDDDSGSYGDDDTPRSMRAAKPAVPPLTLEKLVELEAAMDEVEATPIDDHNPVEILARLRTIAKWLR